MNSKLIIALDQGTTSSRAMLFDDQAQPMAVEQQEFEQHFPKPGWVEHDALQIWDSQFGVLQKLMANNYVKADTVAAIGITNQRETTVVWNKRTGEPVYNAIVWQDRRTADRCEQLKSSDWGEKIKRKTGLIVDAYFSATKVEWILNNVEGARELAENGDLLFGTIDSWLIWNLTEGQVHATDASNASRTMLYNINTGEWDNDLIELFNIPTSMLPEVRDSSGDFGAVQCQGTQIPILGVAGDQQAALFGQTCFEAGMAKNTYGTGCFLLMNTGDKPVASHNGLLSTVAWSLDGKLSYALEGSVFVGGAAVQWLRDELSFFEDAIESAELAVQANPDSEVVVVPAFTGLGAPHWDMYARGAIFGLTRDSGKAEITKATLESLAYQTFDVLQAMQNDCGSKLSELNVDGGAIGNQLLAQFQADILQVPVLRPKNLESTALGAAYLAGLAAGLWTISEIRELRVVDQEFKPNLAEERVEKTLARWWRAVDRSKNWVNHE